MTVDPRPDGPAADGRRRQAAGHRRPLHARGARARRGQHAGQHDGRRVVTGGTGRRAAIPGQTIAGKTGTTQGNKTAAFGGITPDYAVGVMYFNPKGKVSVGGEGGGVPAPIFHDAMAPILGGPAEQALPAGRPGGRGGHQGRWLLAAGAPSGPGTRARADRPGAGGPSAGNPDQGNRPGNPDQGNPGQGGPDQGNPAGTGRGPRRELISRAGGAPPRRRRPPSARPATTPLAAPMTLPMSFMPDAPVRVITSATRAARSASSSWAGR